MLLLVFLGFFWSNVLEATFSSFLIHKMLSQQEAPHHVWRWISFFLSSFCVFMPDGLLDAIPDTV